MNDIANAVEKAFLKTHSHPQIGKDRNRLHLIGSLTNTKDQ